MTKRRKSHARAHAGAGVKTVEIHARRAEFMMVLGIVALWIAMEALTNPRGEFPLNDDWCYARSVFTLLAKHKLAFLDIVPMTLVTQVLWGALFCKILGTSFTALRLSTIVLGCIGVAATYALLREAKAPRWIAFVGCSVVALNPIYLSLSNTFMTDVPFSTFILVALYLYALALKRNSIVWVVAGTVVACGAILIRQLGIIIPAAFMIACLVKDGIRVRSFAKAVAPVLAVLAVLVAYQEWLSHTGRLTSYYGLNQYYTRYLEWGFAEKAGGLWEVVRNLYVYLGIFVLPYLVLAMPSRCKAASPRLRWANRIAAGAMLIAVMDFMIRQDQWMPLKRKAGDIIIDFGLGPPLLTDVFCFGQANLLRAPLYLWKIVSIAGAVGGALLTLHLLLAVEGLCNRKAGLQPFERAFIALMLGAAALYLAPCVPLAAFLYYDRYFICAVPLLLVVIVLTSRSMARPNPILLVLSLVVMLLIGWFAVGATHDYLSWNRTRWQAISDLMHKDGIPADGIDGGYEFNGWYHYRGAKQNWWRVIRDDYMISFGPSPGYTEIKRYPYRRWMPREDASILVLKNNKLFFEK